MVLGISLSQKSVQSWIFRSPIHFTMARSRWSKNALFLLSRLAIVPMSSSLSSKSKTLKFSAMRSLRTDLGMATTPRCVNQRRTTCATLLPYFPARDRGTSLVDLFYVGGGKLDRERIHVLLGVIAVGRTRDRHDPGFAGQEPRERHLTGRRLVAVAHALEQFDHRPVRPPRFEGEAGLRAPEIASLVPHPSTVLSVRSGCLALRT